MRLENGGAVPFEAILEPIPFPADILQVQVRPQRVRLNLHQTATATFSVLTLASASMNTVAVDAVYRVGFTATSTTGEAWEWYCQGQKEQVSEMMRTRVSAEDLAVTSVYEPFDPALLSDEEQLEHVSATTESLIGAVHSLCASNAKGSTSSLEVLMAHYQYPHVEKENEILLHNIPIYRLPTECNVEETVPFELLAPPELAENERVAQLVVHRPRCLIANAEKKVPKKNYVPEGFLSASYKLHS